MMTKVLKTFYVAATIPGALLLPYLNGVFDGALGAVGVVLFMGNHPILGGIMLGYAIVASTLTVALASRKR